MMRPITLFPFPSARLREMAKQGKSFLVVELSNGQMLKDVQLATHEITPVHFYNRMGGMVPSVEELVDVARKYTK
jgi:2-oxoglutarate ferredoxin oxidoreductase subunit alpha